MSQDGQKWVGVKSSTVVVIKLYLIFVCVHTHTHARARTTESIGSDRNLEKWVQESVTINP